MPGMDLYSIAALKRRMVSGKDLSKIMNYFFDKFWDDPVFQKSGMQVDAPKDLQESIYQVIGALFEGDMHVVSILTVEMPGANFMHGAIQIDDDRGMFIWAPDLSTGIMSVSNMKTARTNYVRISITPAAALKRTN